MRLPIVQSDTWEIFRRFSVRSGRLATDWYRYLRFSLPYVVLLWGTGVWGLGGVKHFGTGTYSVGVTGDVQRPMEGIEEFPLDARAVEIMYAGGGNGLAARGGGLRYVPCSLRRRGCMYRSRWSPGSPIATEGRRGGHFQRWLVMHLILLVPGCWTLRMRRGMGVERIRMLT